MKPIKQSDIPLIPGKIVAYYVHYTLAEDRREFRFLKIRSSSESVDIVRFDSPEYNRPQLPENECWGSPRYWSPAIQFFELTDDELTMHYFLELI